MRIYKIEATVEIPDYVREDGEAVDQYIDTSINYFHKFDIKTIEEVK